MKNEHATLTQNAFELAIQDLKLFYSSFKPSTGQMAAWYSRLRFFDDDDLRLAVYEITQERSETPTYQSLLKELWKAHRRRKPVFHPMVRPTEIQAVAEPSDAKKDMCAGYLGKLVAAINRKAPKEEFEKLKEEWAIDFRALPGYRPESDVRQVIAADDSETLARWGILNSHWKEEKKLFIPPFESEKHGSRPRMTNGYDSF